MGKAFKSVVHGITLYVLQIQLWLPVSVILLLIGSVYRFLLSVIPAELGVVQILIHLIFVLALIYLVIGMTQISIGLIKNDKVHSNFSVLFTPVEVLWEPMGLLILFGIMLYFGSVVILPALVMWCLFQFGLLYNLDKDTQIINSLRLSVVSLKKHFLSVFFLDCYLCILMLTGYFLVVFLPICIPVAILTLTHFYFKNLKSITN
jgi:hypothetical protein